MRTTAKILGARASEHSFKFCEQLKISMDPISPLTNKSQNEQYMASGVRFDAKSTMENSGTLCFQ